MIYRIPISLTSVVSWTDRTGRPRSSSVNCNVRARNKLYDPKVSVFGTIHHALLGNSCINIRNRNVKPQPPQPYQNGAHHRRRRICRYVSEPAPTFRSMLTQLHAGRELTQLLLEDAPAIRLITTDIREPPKYGVEEESRLVVVAADLGNKEDVEKLFSYGQVDGVYALQ